MNEDKSNYLQQAINWATQRATTPLKANFDGYEKPKSFVNKRTSEEVAPDISFKGKNGRTQYTVIAVKQENFQKMVTHWKLLAAMATAQNGKFNILAPRGHKMFAQRIVDQYGISGKIYSL